MNGVHGRTTQNMDEPFSGCLGGIVNLFDMSAGVSENKFLADKAHRDRFVSSSSKSDIDSQLDEKMVTPDLRSDSNKTNATPMNKLLEQEMSRAGYNQSPKNVIAKLMGLDTVPLQCPEKFTQNTNFKSISKCSLGDGAMSKGHSACVCDSVNQNACYGTRCNPDHDACKDPYEVRPPASDRNRLKDRLPRKERIDEITCERRMALVQKKLEAKRFAVDEKLHQSKELQGTLEVLSSNRDLFLKFLHESNSMFPEHHHEPRTMINLPETRRITVLRPSNVVGRETTVAPWKISDKKKSMSQGTDWDSNCRRASNPISNDRVTEHAAQSTRIIVLKPSPGKAQDIKAVVPSHSSSRIQQNGIFEVPKGVEARESRRLAKGITKQMRENSMWHRRDETLLSSVYSNGYTGDDSSINKSEDEFLASDPEILSPISRLSSDFDYRFKSPYSTIPFSHPFSHESSVCREAKKRLSERWALMASNACFQEQRSAPRCSSTLGEMLSLSDMRNVKCYEANNEKEQESRVSTSCLTTSISKEGRTSLPRSKSLPISSMMCLQRLDVEEPDAETNMLRSSLRGRVSNLFFSKGKKHVKERSEPCPGDESQKSTIESPSSHVINSRNPESFISRDCLENCLSLDTSRNAKNVALQDTFGFDQRRWFASQEVGASLSKPMMESAESENQDQPSPISVLRTPFEEDDSTVAGADALLKSKVIGKSPPIGSVARTLSWNERCREMAGHHPCTEEDHDWHGLVRTLLSAAELDGEMQSGSFLNKWHSPDNPLNPSLRETYANWYDKELIHEARRRQQRSNRKLVFDCVNSLLVEISRLTTGRIHDSLSCNKPFYSDKPSTLTDCVWAHMKDWFLCEAGDTESLVMEMGVRQVRQDVSGKWWAENMRMESDNVRVCVEKKMIEELIEEAVVELISSDQMKNHIPQFYFPANTK